MPHRIEPIRLHNRYQVLVRLRRLLTEKMISLDAWCSRTEGNGITIHFVIGSLVLVDPLSQFTMIATELDEWWTEVDWSVYTWMAHRNKRNVGLPGCWRWLDRSCHRRQYHLNYIERDAIRDGRKQISSGGDAKEPGGNKTHHGCWQIWCVSYLLPIHIRKIKLTSGPTLLRHTNQQTNESMTNQ